MREELAGAINLLGAYCGRRDLPELSQTALQAQYGLRQADALVLFGGSILAGGDVLAQAIQGQLARHYIIVGGAGHTTEALRQQLAPVLPDLDLAALSEAELFATYIKKAYGLEADYLETESTNCGNNITYLLDLLDREGLDVRSLILCQDATMQQRMDAVLRKYVPNMTIINYATYQARVLEKDGQLRFAQKIKGMWDMERYISLLMGEIPRLRDDEAGYGPRGRNFLAHVDLPEEVQQAFANLSSDYGRLIREANPRYASKADEGRNR